MVEYYLKKKESIKRYKDDDARGIWADSMLHQSKFVYSAIDGVSLSPVLPDHF